MSNEKTAKIELYSVCVKLIKCMPSPQMAGSIKLSEVL